MPSSETPRGSSRRFMWLALAIVVAIGLYTGGWYWFAGQVDAAVGRALATVRSAGNQADCTGRSVRGYPFRIGLFCDTATFARPDGNLSIRATGLRSAANVYQPFRIVGELDRIEARAADPAAGPVTVQVLDVRYSARLDRPLPERASTTAGRIEAQVGGRPVVNAGKAQAHMRTVGAAVDVAASLGAVEIVALPAGGTAPPPFDLAIDANLPDGIALVQRRARSLRGVSAQLRSARLSAGDTGMTVSGPVSVAADGLVDATLTVEIADPPRLLAILAAADPSLKPQIDRFTPMIAALGSRPKLPVAIQKGVVRIGFFTLASLPPLD